MGVGAAGFLLIQFGYHCSIGPVVHLPALGTVELEGHKCAAVVRRFKDGK